jgi:NAD+ kinase
MTNGVLSPFIGQNQRGQWREHEDERLINSLAVPPTKDGLSPCTNAMNNLLRQYNTSLDPLNTSNDSRIEPSSASAVNDDTQSPLSAASTRYGSDSHELATTLPLSPKFPLHTPKSFFSHRKGALSTDHMPQQSIMKAIASRPLGGGRIPPVSIAESLAKSLDAAKDTNASLALPTSVSDARTPSTARLTSLQSPCFFHQRFDDAVNIERVMEEIQAEEDGFSHSRLMQTATSVREISKQLQRRPIKRAVRSVMIVTKARDNSLVHLTRELALWLLSTPRYSSDVGVNVYVDEKLRTSKRFDAPGIVAENRRFDSMLRYWNPDLCWSSPELFDLVLTLGGDGTVLFTSFCLFQRVVPPVLAFSLGSLGFLTNFEFADYKRSLDNVMGEAGMRVNLRMRFTCTVYRANLDRKRGAKASPVDTASMVEGEQFEVLNELVIDRGPSPYVSNLELYGDDELLTVVQADGCIFSTPTGSTAYSLSAGGPLTHPSIPGIMLTPICPHTLSFRPMVLSDSLMLKVCIPKNSRSTAYASFDGKHRVELRRGDCVQVEAGRYPLPTVVGEHGTGGEWFESVRRALRWNTRGAVQKGFSSRKDAKPNRKEDIEDDFEDIKPTEDDDEEDCDETEEEWDINPDPISPHSALDSGLGASEVSESDCASPRRPGIFA